MALSENERHWPTYREGLIQKAYRDEVTRAYAEMPVLKVLSNDSLKEIIEYYGQPSVDRRARGTGRGHDGVRPE